MGQTIDDATTDFALDVQGLPEVVYTSDGNAYLHLPGLIMAASPTEGQRYLLADGLGSIRHAADDAATVAVYQEFDPYGVPLMSEGGGDPYGFTGEWWADEVDLLHLRARWYAPEDGIFLSRDPIDSEPPYQYVRGNPVNLTDPSGYQTECNANGYCPEIDRFECWRTWQEGWGAYDLNWQPCIVNPANVQTGNGPSWPLSPSSPSTGTGPQEITGYFQRDDRDLTFWLFNELKDALQNPDLQLIKEMERRTPNTLLNTAMAGTYWRALVRNKARYDFKHEIQDQMFESIFFRANNGTPLWVDFSVPGNIFFGYAGSYVGFPRYVTHVGAGYAQAVDQVKKIRNICDIPRYLPPSTIRYLGDSPEDYRGVKFGIDLWKRYGANLTLFQFRDELERSHDQLAPAPQLPGSGNIPPFGWRNTARGWPYKTGDFKGPEADKHWPPRPENGFGFGEF